MPDDSHSLSDYEYYEPQYFAFSPTYKSWVKLFIRDCFALTSLDGFEGTQARFWKNHPIRWIQLVGIVVGVDIKSAFAELDLDDGSGANISVHIRGDVGETINLDTERNYCTIDVGDLIRVKGTLVANHRSELQFVADKIDTFKDPLLELKAWQERVDFHKTVLDVPWHCDIDKLTEDVYDSKVKAVHDKHSGKDHKGRRHHLQLAEHARKQEEVKRQAVMDLHLLAETEHTQRNLKLVFLHYLHRTRLRNFTVTQLRASPELERAVVCVTRNRLNMHRDAAGMRAKSATESPPRISSSQRYRTINACLAELVRDGSIISTGSNQQGTYSVVGKWNLGVRMQEIMQDMFAADSQRVEVTTREMWQAVRTSGRGFESVSKQIVQKVLAEMQADCQTDAGA